LENTEDDSSMPRQLLTEINQCSYAQGLISLLPIIFDSPMERQRGIAKELPTYSRLWSV